jgi:hypothetical protein
MHLIYQLQTFGEVVEEPRENNKTSTQILYLLLSYTGSIYENYHASSCMIMSRKRINIQ